MNISDGFVKVAPVSEFREHRGRRFMVKDVEIALFLVNGNFYALSNMCPHQHASIIYDGFIENGSVICPAHGWEFDLKTGNKSNGSRGLRSFEVIVSSGSVYVKIPAEE